MLDCEKFNRAEHQVKELLESQGFIVIDQTGNESMYSKDIDFTVYNPLDHTYIKNIEVKECKNISHYGTMFIELSDDVFLNRKGWIYTTEADEVWYCDYYNDIAYVFHPQEMRNYLKNNSSEFFVRTHKGRGKDSDGAIVSPVKYAENYHIRTEKLKPLELAHE